MLDRLEKVKERYEELTRLLSDPDVVSNQERYRLLSNESERRSGGPEGDHRDVVGS
jgi:protein subunit release factor A